MDSHAQLEIRSYADVIGKEIVSKWCPHAWESFCDYRLNGMFLTRLDIEIIKNMNYGNMGKVRDIAVDFGWFTTKKDGSLKNNRERSELENKLNRLGIDIPWN